MEYIVVIGSSRAFNNYCLEISKQDPNAKFNRTHNCIDSNNIRHKLVTRTVNLRGLNNIIGIKQIYGCDYLPQFFEILDEAKLKLAIYETRPKDL